MKEATMKTKEYDFSGARRSHVADAGPRKTRITIRIDDDILDWFRSAVHNMGGGNYQTLINTVLREHVQSHEVNHLESMLRKIIREELKHQAC